MAENNVTVLPTSCSQRRPTPNARKPESWPVLWRVVMPCAGREDQDVVFFQSTEEREARARFHALRCAEYPVRLEKVRVGSLPKDFQKGIEDWRKACRQNPGEMPPVPVVWFRESTRQKAAVIPFRPEE